MAFNKNSHKLNILIKARSSLMQLGISPDARSDVLIFEASEKLGEAIRALASVKLAGKASPKLTDFDLLDEKWGNA